MVSSFSTTAGRSLVARDAAAQHKIFVKPDVFGAKPENNLPAEQKHSWSDQAKSLQDRMCSIRRTIHAHPELAFEEKQTSALAIECLKSAGFSAQIGSIGTGVIGDLNLGVAKTVAIKTEIDALPISEMNQVMYRSQIANVMHACGHDAHVVAVIGAAEILSKQASGGVRIIMQAGEHAGEESEHRGASSMIADGVLSGVDAILGFHLDATMPLGQVGVMEGVFFNLRSDFEIEFDFGVDSMEAVTVVLSALRENNKNGRGLFRVQDINAKAQQASISGYYSCDDVQVREQNFRHLHEVCAAASHGKYCLAISSNDADLELHKKTIACAYDTAVDVMGAANTCSIKRRTWTREFAEYASRRPAAFLLFGTHVQGQKSIQHTASFDFDESVMVSIAAVLAGTVLNLQNQL